MQTLTGESEISQERRHLTVMFCDVVGSTALSSRQDIEAYFSILRAYYDACEPVVKRHEGLVAQHQGDGIFVWFGYPEPKDDDAIRAVRAGLDLLVVLRRLSADMESLGGEALTVRMAAHAGEVLVAAVDGEKMPIAFGHTPNVAAKLQQAARPGSFVISDAVRRLTRDTFELTPLDPSRLGDGSTIPVFEVVAERRPASREHVWRTPLIGREAEQHQLTDARAASANGASAAILLVGERGIGKSRLASAIAGDPTPARSTVLECACHPLDAGSAYRPFRSLLSQAAGIEPDDPPIVGSALLQRHLIDELGMDAAAAAILGQIMSFGPELTGPATDLDPARLGQITNDLLIDWIARVSAAAPTLMLIDDVPDADPSSLAVLGQVTTALPPGLLLLFTARSDSTLPAFLRLDAVETVELKQLADTAADQLVRAIESTIAIDPARRLQVLQLGEGVPLYLEELARAAQETSTTGRLPITLTERLQARLTAPTIDREIVGVLAAAGQDVEESLLAAVLGVSVDEMRTRLQGLLSADLVVHAGATASSLRFRHGLIGEAAYARLLNAQRAELHARLATAMQQYRQDGRTIDWSVVGQHLRRAGRDLDAFEAILAGAEQARNAGAITEALLGYQDALQVVNDVADPTVRDILEVRCRLQRGITAISDAWLRR